MTNIKATTIAAMTATLLSSGAYASDLNGSLKDGGSADSPSVVNWSGFYIGGSVGYGNSNHNLSVHDYFKDYCDGADDETVGFEGGSSVADTLENINKDVAASDHPDWKKLALKRSDCATRTGHVQPTGDANIPNDYPISTSTGDVTIAGDSREVASLDGVNAHGVVGDVRLGYDQAFGRFLVGVWGSYGLNAMEATAVNNIAGFLPNAQLEKQDEWAIGARAGLIVAPRTLAYILAGYANTSYDFSGVETISTPAGKAFSKETDFNGVVVGGGVEFALTSNVYVGLEYQHTFYGEEAIFDVYNKSTNVGGRIDDDLDEDKVMLTIKAKLNGFGR